MSDHILVFDFGTTYFKAGLVDSKGGLTAIVRYPTPSTTNRLGHVEIEPENFRQVIRAACCDLGSRQPTGLKSVRAITFATQANTFTVLDRDDKPLTPLIVWTDHRAEALGVEIATWTSDPTYTNRSGIPALDGFFAAAKLKWIREHQPRLHAAAARVCFLGDYFVHWLTGKHLTDGSVAGLSGLFDIQAWTWPADWARRADVETAWLPGVVRSGSSVGTLLQDVADELGLDRGCNLIMGILDQHAGAIGVGNTDADLISETTGTVLATIRCSSQLDPPSCHDVYSGPSADVGRFYHMMFSNISASLLDTFRNALPGKPSAEELDALVEVRSRPSLRLDHLEPIESLRECLTRLAATELPADIVASIYHVVAHALADQVAILAPDLPNVVIHSGGGAARSRKWLQIKSNVSGHPFLMPDVAEPTLRGAAMLAYRWLGWSTAHSQSHQVATADILTPQ